MGGGTIKTSDSKKIIKIKKSEIKRKKAPDYDGKVGQIVQIIPELGVINSYILHSEVLPAGADDTRLHLAGAHSLHTEATQYRVLEYSPIDFQNSQSAGWLFFQ